MAKDELNFDEALFDEAAIDKKLNYMEMPLSRWVFIGLGLATGIVTLIFSARLWQLNVADGQIYLRRAGANVNKEVIVPAPRGIIIDRFGEVLASNTNILSAFVDMGELLQAYGTDKIDEVADKLAEILQSDPMEMKNRLLAIDWQLNDWVLLEQDISVSEGISIKALNLPFIKLVNDYSRQYIDGPVFSHLVGYIGFSDTGNAIVGKVGLENYYDDRLRGQDGYSVIYRDTYGNVLEEKIGGDPMIGQTLTTTIDADLQRYFYTSLAAQLRRLGRNAGVGIVLNPQNGEILALVSLPSYDNNLLIARGHNEEKQDILTSSSKPLFNRAVSGMYTPGSTIKPLVALAALKEKIIDPQHQIFSAGFIEIPNPYFPDKPSRFLDWKPHGWVDLHSALARSSNIYFYALGGGLDEVKGLGIVKLKTYWQKFGLGKPMGVDLNNEKSGFLPDPETKQENTGDIWRIGDTYNVSIGQGDLLLTPLQLISFFASIANGGRIYQPHLLKDDSATSTVMVDYSDWVDEIKEVQLGMEDVVNQPYGSAYSLHDLPLTAAGKTGTAQIAGNTRTNAIFVSYFTADDLIRKNIPLDKQIAVLVLVENSLEGSLNAVPVAEEVLRWWYYNRIASSE